MQNNEKRGREEKKGKEGDVRMAERREKVKVGGEKRGRKDKHRREKRRGEGKR